MENGEFCSANESHLQMDAGAAEASATPTTREMQLRCVDDRSPGREELSGAHRRWQLVGARVSAAAEPLTKVICVSLSVRIDM